MRVKGILTIIILFIINILIYSEYKLQRYVLSEGGGVFLKTSSYNIGLTIGQSIIGKLEGDNFTVYIGFWKPNETDISYIEGEEKVREIVKKYDFRLYQNYPNPFKERTRIYYSIPKSGEVRMELIDVNGRMIDVLLDEYKGCGIYYVDLIARERELSSGVYLYRLIMGEEIKVKRLLKIN